MKKIWKIALISVLTLTLAACGSNTNDEQGTNNTNNNQNEVVDTNNNQNDVENSNNEQFSSNKLVATKTEEDPATGEKVESKTEIAFDENGKATLVVSTQVFENQETADQTYALLSLVASMATAEGETDFKVTQDGTTIITEMPTTLEGTTFNTGDAEIPANEATIEDVRRSLELEKWIIQE